MLTTPVTMKKFTEWKNVGGTCKLAEVEVKGYVINFLDGLKVNNEQFHKMCHISFRPCFFFFFFFFLNCYLNRWVVQQLLFFNNAL